MAELTTAPTIDELGTLARQYQALHSSQRSVVGDTLALRVRQYVDWHERQLNAALVVIEADQILEHAEAEFTERLMTELHDHVGEEDDPDGER